MKKLFAAFALVMGLGTTVAFAENAISATNNIVANVNDFTPIEVKDLPQPVQDALADAYKDFTVKSAAVEANEDGTAVYQIVLTDAEGKESTVKFNEKGEELKDNTEEICNE